MVKKLFIFLSKHPRAAPFPPAAVSAHSVCRRVRPPWPWVARALLLIYRWRRRMAATGRAAARFRPPHSGVWRGGKAQCAWQIAAFALAENVPRVSELAVRLPEKSSLSVAPCPFCLVGEAPYMSHLAFFGSQKCSLSVAPCPFCLAGKAPLVSRFAVFGAQCAAFW